MFERNFRISKVTEPNPAPREIVLLLLSFLNLTPPSWCCLPRSYHRSSQTCITRAALHTPASSLCNSYHFFHPLSALHSDEFTFDVSDSEHNGELPRRLPKELIFKGGIPHYGRPQGTYTHTHTYTQIDIQTHTQIHRPAHRQVFCGRLSHLTAKRAGSTPVGKQFLCRQSTYSIQLSKSSYSKLNWRLGLTCIHRCV